ncbi:hypothetical protein EBR57_08945, partial [bacterium]|nr:hypothetical protein [bacterium]
SNQLGASTDYMKVSIYLSIMKVLQDAMEGTIAQMFGRGKTNTVSNFDSQIDAIVNKESSILDAFRSENQARMNAINSQQAKETRIQNQTISLSRAGAKLGLHGIRAIADAFFVFFPMIFAESALYLSYIGIENAVKVATAVEETSVMMATAFGKFGFYNIDYHNDSSPYSSPAADPTFETRLASADPDKYTYPTTSYDDIYENLNMSQQLFPEPVSAATKERVAKQYGPYSRMDEEEALILDGLNNFSKNDSDSILTSSSDMLGIGGDFRQIDFEKLLEAYQAMTKVNQIRTFMTMIDQAMYNAKQNALRAMFGGNAGGGHGALNVMASGIDRYTTSIMGSMAGQTGIFQDFLSEAQGRMDSVNDYTLGAINLSVEGTIKGTALLAQGIAGLRAYTAAATLAATGGLTIDTYNKKVGRMFNGVATAAMLANVAQIAVGVTMMKSVIANHPQITSELLNYEEDDTVEGANPADSAEAQRQNAKLKGKPAESSINFDPKNPSNTHNTDAAKPNYGLSGSGSVDSQGVKQRVNAGDQARMEKLVSRKTRQ